MSKIEDVRLSVAKSLTDVLNNEFFLFNESLKLNQYRVTWMKADNSICVLCQIGDISIVECPIITVVFHNACVDC